MDQKLTNAFGDYSREFLEYFKIIRKKKAEYSKEEIEKLLDKLNRLIIIAELLGDNLDGFEKLASTTWLNFLKQDIGDLKDIKLENELEFVRISTNILTHVCSLQFVIFNRHAQDCSLEKEKIREFEEVSRILLDKNIINENWSPAVLLLQSIETVINKKLLEKGENWKKIEFKDRLSKLGVSIKEGDVILNNAFWNLRAKILHEGYLLDKDELDIIKIGSRMIIERVLEI